MICTKGMDASNKYCDDYSSAIFVKVHKVRLLSTVLSTEMA